METIKELLEILSKTPETALWGLGIYLLFMLLKLASWVGALTLVSKLFINRFFNYKLDKETTLRESIKIEELKTVNRKYELDISHIKKWDRLISSEVIGDASALLNLLNLMKKEGSAYVRQRDIQEAVQLILKSKKDDSEK